MSDPPSLFLVTDSFRVGFSLSGFFLGGFSSSFLLTADASPLAVPRERDLVGRVLLLPELPVGKVSISDGADAVEGVRVCGECSVEFLQEGLWGEETRYAKDGGHGCG